MIYVTSDLHGYPLDRFLALLEKAGFDGKDELYILGDVIDRNGDGGIRMLQWIMSMPNVHMLMGNHEAMLLSLRISLRRGDGAKHGGSMNAPSSGEDKAQKEPIPSINPMSETDYVRHKKS